jgi:hypothetical protein
MKKKNYHTFGAVPKSNKITRERGKNGYYRQSVVRIDTLYYAVNDIFFEINTHCSFLQRYLQEPLFRGS